MFHLLPGFGRWLRVALAAGTFGSLAGSAAWAQAPVCNGHNVYPCSIGSTLLVLSKPNFTLNGGSGITSGGNGNHPLINDPQNPGFSFSGFGNLIAPSPALPSAAGAFN